MRCLDIVRMIVPPRSSHPFGIPVIWNHIRVIRELFVTDGTFPALLHDLPVQQFSHLGRRPEFAIASGVMRIFEPLYTEPYDPGPRDEFSTAAGN
ncbi:MAG: hypothetical protein WAM39_27880 [Bryobacteraceae bacterium]